MARLVAVTVLIVFSVVGVGCGAPSDPLADESLRHLDPESGELDSKVTWTYLDGAFCSLSLWFQPSRGATQDDLVQEILESDELGEWPATDVPLAPRPGLGSCEPPLSADEFAPKMVGSPSATHVYSGTKSIDGAEFLVWVKRWDGESNSVEILMVNNRF